MSDREFERALTDWLEDGTDRTPERAIDGVLLAIRTTPQERDLGIPWRLPSMLALPRATGIAAVALVAVVGAGGLLFLANRAPDGTGAGAPAPSVAPTAASTVAPTPDPTPAPSDAAAVEWTPYTSEVYGISIDYPSGWNADPAARAWPDDGKLVTDDGVWDLFSGEQDDIAVIVSAVPAGEGADLESAAGLEAWYRSFCAGFLPDCEAHDQPAEELCLTVGDGPCMTAIHIPGDSPTDPGNSSGELVVVPSRAMDRVYLLNAGRGDTWPGAARFGGAVQLMKDMIASIEVTEP
jgi:hypothetical protein